MFRINLASRIRITFDPRKMGKSSEKKIRYYEKYAFFVSKTLKEPLFQTFLHRILRKENIKIDNIRDIQIKTFPFIKENGNRLFGKCNNKGVICLYPKEIRLRQKRALTWRENKIKNYVKCRARAALVHEVLHLKYLNKEVKVRELTRKYFNSFIMLKSPDVNNQTIINQLFPQPA